MENTYNFNDGKNEYKIEILSKSYIEMVDSLYHINVTFYLSVLSNSFVKKSSNEEVENAFEDYKYKILFTNEDESNEIIFNFIGYDEKICSTYTKKEVENRIGHHYDIRWFDDILDEEYSLKPRKVVKDFSLNEKEIFEIIKLFIKYNTVKDGFLEPYITLLVDYNNSFNTDSL